MSFESNILDDVNNVNNGMYEKKWKEIAPRMTATAA